MKIKDEISRGFKLTNPYSESAFPTMQHGYFQNLVKLLESNGYSFDNLYGNIGRAVWDNCVRQVVDLMDNYVEKDFLEWLNNRSAILINDKVFFYVDEGMNFPINKAYEYWLINIKK